MTLDDLRLSHDDQFDARFPGFQFLPGWTALLADALGELARLAPDARITQAKEKLGGLRIHCLDSQLDEPAREALRRIEERSLSTCEVCGESGARIASDGWVRVRCSAHEDE
jgi:hypothetical protein